MLIDLLLILPVAIAFGTKPLPWGWAAGLGLVAAMVEALAATALGRPPTSLGNALTLAVCEVTALGGYWGARWLFRDA